MPGTASLDGIACTGCSCYRTLAIVHPVSIRLPVHSLSHQHGGRHADSTRVWTYWHRIHARSVTYFAILSTRLTEARPPTHTYYAMSAASDEAAQPATKKAKSNGVTAPLAGEEGRGNTTHTASARFPMRIAEHKYGVNELSDITLVGINDIANTTSWCTKQSWQHTASTSKLCLLEILLPPR